MVSVCGPAHTELPAAGSECAIESICPLKTENLEHILRKAVRCPHKTEVRLTRIILK